MKGSAEEQSVISGLYLSLNLFLKASSFSLLHSRWKKTSTAANGNVTYKRYFIMFPQRPIFATLKTCWFRLYRLVVASENCNLYKRKRT